MLTLRAFCALASHTLTLGAPAQPRHLQGVPAELVALTAELAALGGDDARLGAPCAAARVRPPPPPPAGTRASPPALAALDDGATVGAHRCTATLCSLACALLLFTLGADAIPSRSRAPQLCVTPARRATRPRASSDCARRWAPPKAATHWQTAPLGTTCCAGGPTASTPRASPSARRAPPAAGALREGAGGHRRRNPTAESALKAPFALRADAIWLPMRRAGRARRGRCWAAAARLGSQRACSKERCGACRLRVLRSLRGGSHLTAA